MHALVERKETLSAQANPYWVLLVTFHFIYNATNDYVIKDSGTIDFPQCYKVEIDSDGEISIPPAPTVGYVFRVFLLRIFFESISIDLIVQEFAHRYCLKLTITLINSRATQEPPIFIFENFWEVIMHAITRKRKLKKLPLTSTN